jgi:hypothetical protein
MKNLWRKIKAYFSGWPEGPEEKVSENIKKEVTTKKAKKPKGLKSQKKKKKQAK